MVVKTTKNESISSVHIGSIKNPLDLYNLLNTILGDEASIFTKPIIKQGSIEWETNFSGEVISYSKSSEEMKHIIVGILRDKVKNILKGKSGDHKNLLKLSLEIPDESDIHLIGNEIILTNWGHIKNAYNAKREIVFELIGKSESLLQIEVFKDGQPLNGVDIKLKYSNKTVNLKTDSQEVIKEFVPIGVDVEVTGKFNGEKSKVIKKTIKESNENIKIEINSSEKRWWLLPLIISLFLLTIGILCLIFKCKFGGSSDVSEKSQIKIVWKESLGDFDLHIIDSCGNLIDNFHKEANCKGEKVEFIQESQGFKCKNGLCEEIIVVPEKVINKIIINQFSKNKNLTSSPKVDLIIKRTDGVINKRELKFKDIHPMLKNFQADKSRDVIIEWRS